MLKSILLFSAISFLPFAAQATTLNDLLNIALHQQSQRIKPKPLASQTGHWLAETPKWSMEHQRTRSDVKQSETSLGLNFSIKSPSARKIDRELVESGEQQLVWLSKLHRLELSGQIRSILWEHRLLQEQFKTLQAQIKLLHQLKTQSKARLQAQVTDRLSHLLILQELKSKERQASELQSKLNHSLSALESLTGQRQVPNNLEEADFNEADSERFQHPEIQLLNAQWAFKQNQWLSEKSYHNPWDLSVYLQQIKDQDLDTHFIGLGVEIPIGAVKIESVSQQSEYAIERQWFNYETTQKALRINQSLKQALAERQNLLKQDENLRAIYALQKALLEELKLQKSKSDFSQSQLLRQKMLVIESEGNIKHQALRIQQQNSTLRQLAGISL